MSELRRLRELGSRILRASYKATGSNENLIFL
jgi:hypothetical protein